MERPQCIQLVPIIGFWIAFSLLLFTSNRLYIQRYFRQTYF
uniref:Macaca fascicularis brain cDNA clone: QflA-17867, similar to human hypothetical protein FLJ10846 (FLJ10846), mRNA, RefSeq: NM_018241.1 n=1 Tax=Macaca fascicularis TaxID=9541 RepID=I7G5J1_MACFA|nr:unnamed protein product [Macaca fascicularis]